MSLTFSTNPAASRGMMFGQSRSSMISALVPNEGDTGPAGTITIGTVTALDPGEAPTVTNSGTSSAAILDFALPAGEDGAGAGEGLNPAYSYSALARADLRGWPIFPGYNFIAIPELALPTWLTLTAAGTRWATGPNGLLRSTSAGSIRHAYVQSTGAYRGIQIEGLAATNVALHSRDLSISHQLVVTSLTGTFITGETVTATGGGSGIYVAAESDATRYAIRTGSGTFTGTLTGGSSGATVTISSVATCWVLSSATALRTSVGADGVANSATRVTATGANGTVLQSITLASSSRVQSARVRRVTGTGTVEMTTNGGTDWFDITSLINSSTYTLVVDTARTVTNPQVGFRIVTSADAIDVDFAQNETTISSSPIPTTVVSVTRAAESLADITLGDWFNPLEGALYFRGSVRSLTGLTENILVLDDGTSNEIIRITKNTSNVIQMLMTDGGVTQAAISGSAFVADTDTAVIARYRVNDCALSQDGSTVSKDTSCTIPTPTALKVGRRVTNTNPANFYIRQFAVFGIGPSDNDMSSYSLTGNDAFATAGP